MISLDWALMIEPLLEDVVLVVPSVASKVFEGLPSGSVHQEVV